MTIVAFPQPDLPPGGTVRATHRDGHDAWYAVVPIDGACPHLHRTEIAARICLTRFVRWRDYRDQREAEREQPDGRFLYHRRPPGPRPSRPW